MLHKQHAPVLKGLLLGACDRPARCKLYMLWQENQQVLYTLWEQDEINRVQARL